MFGIVHFNAFLDSIGNSFSECFNENRMTANYSLCSSYYSTVQKMTSDVALYSLANGSVLMLFGGVSKIIHKIFTVCNVKTTFFDRLANEGLTKGILLIILFIALSILWTTQTIVKGYVEAIIHDIPS